MGAFLVGISPDVTTKSSRTRIRFQARLVRNIREALDRAGHEGRVDDRWGRLLIESPDPGAKDRIAAVFGVHSVMQVEARVPADLDAIVRAGEATFSSRVRDRAFAVRARRAGEYPFRSRDIEVALGAALDRYGHVDLDHPDVTVRVEVRDGEAFMSCARTAGVGGLPLGVEGRAVALLSGGYDSPVASWMMLRRGISLDYVFCNLAGDAYERSVVSVAKVLADLWSFGDRPRLHVIDFAEPLDALRAASEERYWQVLLKRLMYRAAAAVAAPSRAQAIVTGESVGQVSSQTLANLRAIEDGCPLPVLRPVLGLDKLEIMRRAQDVGTAVLSAQIQEYCQLGRARPVTSTTPELLARQEARLDQSSLHAAIASRKVLDLRRLDEADLSAPYLFVDVIPDGAVVLDCRSEAEYETWHYPGSERREPTELAARFRRLDKTRAYVLYCGVGVQSAHVAELMQQGGYEAYSFKGGVPRLRRYAERSAKDGVPASSA